MHQLVWCVLPNLHEAAVSETAKEKYEIQRSMQYSKVEYEIQQNMKRSKTWNTAE